MNIRFTYCYLYTSLIIAFGVLGARVAFGQGISAQNDFKLRFQHYANSDGLTNSLVHDLAVDDDNNVWVATLDGISVFNGYDFKVFEKDFNVGSKRFVFDKNPGLIYPDSHGNFWVWYNSGGLILHQPVADTTLVFLEEEGNLNGNFAYRLEYSPSLFEDSQGRVWIGSVKGVNRFSYEKGQVDLSLNKSSGLEEDIIICFGESSDGRVWVGTMDGLNWVDKDDRVFPVVGLFKDTTEDGKILSIATEGDSVVWVGTKMEGLKKLTFKDEGVIMIETISLENTAPRINAILQASDQSIWLGTDIGLCHLILNEEREVVSFNFVRIKDENEEEIIYGPVHLLEDQRGNIWAGASDHTGLWYYDVAAKKLNNYLHREGQLQGLQSNDITEIEEDSKGIVWVGTAKGGISKVDIYQKSFHHIYRDHTQKNAIISNDVYSFYETKDQVWVGTSYGLNLVDIETGKVKKTFVKGEGDKNLKGNIVGVIKPTKDHKLWLGYYVISLVYLI